MRLVFVYLSSTKVEDRFLPSVNSGVFILKTILKENGFSSSIIDLSLLLNQGKLRPDKSFFPAAARFILKKKPEFVCFSADCFSFPILIKLADRMKKIDPSIINIFGGPQPTTASADSLKYFSSMDFIIKGEGEAALIELLGKIIRQQSPSKIAGLTYRDEAGSIHDNPDRQPIGNLDKFPLPDFKSDPTFKKYLKSGVDYARVDVGRGCPYNCTFCSTSLFFNRYYRMRSPLKILDYIKYMKKTFGIKEFLFSHDNFTYQPKVVKFLCRHLSTEKDIKWVAAGRINNMSDASLREMASAGCIRLEIGVESGSDRIQRIIHKNLDLRKVIPFVRLAKKYNIAPRLSFIIGFPEETEKDLNDSLKLMLYSSINGALVSLYRLIPLTGTRLLNLHNKKLFLPKKPPVASFLFRGIKDIVNKYPILFSAYYEIRGQYLAPALLYHLDQYYPLLLQWFPYSFFLLCRERKVEPLQLFKYFIDSRRPLRGGSDLIAKFYLFAKNIAGKYPSAYLLDALHFEYKLFKMMKKRSSSIIKASHNLKYLKSSKIFLSSIPRVPPYVFAELLPYNPIELSNHLKYPADADDIRNISAEKTNLLAKLSSKINWSIKYLNKKEAEVFTLVDSKRKIREIIDRAPSRYLGKEDRKLAASKILLNLVKEGFVYLS